MVEVPGQFDVGFADFYSSAESQLNTRTTQGLIDLKSFDQMASTSPEKSAELCPSDVANNHHQRPFILDLEFRNL